MALLVRLFRALAAVVLSILIGVVAFVVSGALLWWFLTATFRGGDSIVVLVGGWIGGPILLGASLMLMVWLSVVFYRKFSGTSKKLGAGGNTGV